MSNVTAITNITSDGANSQIAASITPRQIIAIVILIATTIYFIGSWAAFLIRRKEWPILQRSWQMVFISSCGGYLTLTGSVIAREIVTRDLYPCWIYFWSTQLFIPIFGFPYLIRAFLLDTYVAVGNARIAWHDEETKAGPAGALPATSSDRDLERKRKANTQKLQLLKRLLWRVSPAGQWTTIAIAFIPFALFAIFVFIKNPDFSPGHIGCRFSASFSLFYGGIALVYTICVIYMLWRIRNAADEFFIKSEILDIMVIQLLFNIAYFIINFVPSVGDAATKAGFNGGYVTVAMFWCTQWISVIMPTVASYGFYFSIFGGVYPRKREVTMDELTFDMVLADPNGVKFFTDHLVREFSTENINFWKEVNRFKLLKSLEDGGGEEVKEMAMKIFNEYVLEGSMNQVNLPSKCRKDIEARVAKGDINVDLLDQAQKEIVFLMSKDSFARFKRGDLCAEFMKKHKPKVDVSLNSRVNKAKTGGMEGSTGSAVSMQEVIKQAVKEDMKAITHKASLIETSAKDHDSKDKDKRSPASARSPAASMHSESVSSAPGSRASSIVPLMTSSSSTAGVRKSVVSTPAAAGVLDTISEEVRVAVSPVAVEEEEEDEGKNDTESKEIEMHTMEIGDVHLDL